MFTKTYHSLCLTCALLLFTNCNNGSNSSQAIVELAELNVSISNLALATSGAARTITISNTGDITATALNIDYPTWPLGTTANSTCGATLTPASSCTITITPGANASSSCNTTGIAPTPHTITLSASNADDVIADVSILNYGCIYQGGYIFAIDDTTPASGSMGGKVVSQSDQAPRWPNGVIWSSNGSGGVVLDIIYGISETSTTSTPNPNTNQISGQVACNGAYDGACNSANIYTYYQNAGPIDLSFYAAGRCQQTMSGYTDWYLPSICEMGPSSNGSGCAPGTQNIVTNLSSLVGDPGLASPETNCGLGANCLAGYYWSSSEVSVVPQSVSWEMFFSTGGGSGAGTTSKNEASGVRCVRAITL